MIYCSVPNDAEIFMGISDGAVDGTFRWVDGTSHNPTTDFNDWYTGYTPQEPRNTAIVNDCGVIGYGSERGWRTRLCTMSVKIYCQRTFVGKDSTGRCYRANDSKKRKVHYAVAILFLRKNAFIFYALFSVKGVKKFL